MSVMPTDDIVLEGIGLKKHFGGGGLLSKPTIVRAVDGVSLAIRRGETFAIREQDYVLAARALGASDRRIMFNHIIPNIASIMIINLMITVGNLILIESALSFLGIGIQPPTPSWGNMLSRAQSFFSTGPHMVVFPGLLIVITVLCLYILGDGLRDAFDPNAVD